MSRMLLLVALGTFLSFFWPAVATAQQPPPTEWLENPSVQNDTTLQLDTARDPADAKESVTRPLHFGLR